MSLETSPLMLKTSLVVGRVVSPAVGAALCAAAVLALPAVSRASASDLYYERAVVANAGERCHLFAPELLGALEAAEAQARGAALRGGAQRATLDRAAEAAATKAQSVACNSQDLATIAQRVRTAFEGFSHLQAMTYPGDHAAWRAERPLSRKPRWTLSQQINAPARATFGLVNDNGKVSLVLVTSDLGALRASTARLVLRDGAKAPDAYIDARRSDLAGHVAPRWCTRTFLASAKGEAPETLDIVHGQASAAFTFPKEAIAALADLDPREAVAIELVYPGVKGDRVDTVLVEVGDFAAGRAFVLAAKR